MAMTEAQIQRNIKETCKDQSFTYYHTRNSMQSDKGFPDVCIAGPVGSDAPSTFFYETKTLRRRVTDEQLMWLDVLTKSGIVARLIYEDVLPGKHPEFEGNLADVYADIEQAYRRHLEAHRADQV